MKMTHRANDAQKSPRRLVLRLGDHTPDGVRWMAPWRWALRLRVMR